jgi:uroporphyrinogen-III synthase
MKAPARTNKPLAGLRVLVGRARHQASALSSGLQALGAEVIEVPFIEIRPPRSYVKLDSALDQIAEYDWLILTSVNGVDAMASRLKRLRISAESLRHLRIAAIGPATRDAIGASGMKVSVIPERYVAESVVESLRGKVKGKRILLARAKVARDVIPRELHRMGARVDVVEAYETVVPAASRKRLRTVMANAGLRPDVVCFTSSSTVRNLVELLGAAPNRNAPTKHGFRSGGTSANSPALQRRGKMRTGSSPRGTIDPWKLPDTITFASIGPITSSTMRELGLPVHIEADECTIPGLIRATRNWAVARRHDERREVRK